MGGFQNLASNNSRSGRKKTRRPLARVNFHPAFTFAAIDAAVVEIDFSDPSAVAGKVDDAATLPLVESVADIGSELLIIGKCNDDI